MNGYDEYSIFVQTIPFGICFTNKNPTTNEIEHGNLFIQHVDKDNPCHDQIIIGSKLIQLENTTVEGIKCSESIRMCQIAYSNCMARKCSFKIKLRKPDLMLMPSISKQNGTVCATARTIFIDINLFYENWRTIPSGILVDVILIFPHIHIEWITELETTNILNINYNSNLINSLDHDWNTEDLWIDECKDMKTQQ
eukprot:6796_1